jgi:hypothetical protein
MFKAHIFNWLGKENNTIIFFFFFFVIHFCACWGTEPYVALHKIITVPPVCCPCLSPFSTPSTISPLLFKVSSIALCQVLRSLRCLVCRSETKHSLHLESCSLHLCVLYLHSEDCTLSLLGLTVQPPLHALMVSRLCRESP